MLNTFVYLMSYSTVLVQDVRWQLFSKLCSTNCTIPVHQAVSTCCAAKDGHILARQQGPNKKNILGARAFKSMRDLKEICTSTGAGLNSALTRDPLTILVSRAF